LELFDERDPISGRRPRWSRGKDFIGSFPGPHDVVGSCRYVYNPKIDRSPV
jgi:hypothetical protein